VSVTKVLAIAQDGGGLGISAVRAIWPMAALNARPDFECKWVRPQDVASELMKEEGRSLKGYDVYLQVRANAEVEEGFDPLSPFRGGAVHTPITDFPAVGETT